ncbi:hypothetical protein CYY_010350 [Polysphondylium violaceum]|uniref:U3 small nucleolar RNA-associated protein 25 n=1 Tax=Polysphondylium violaceum TaxID=133409 RepID=A0A8J4V1S4_9MYCE|nr:hypothetical protein CYY_010350 [Polysphondylium violaceum]
MAPKGKKQKISKKVAKKFTIHRKYYSDTFDDYSALNPLKRGQTKENKLLELSKKQQERNVREKEQKEKEEIQDLQQEIGGDVDTLYEVGPSSYDLFVSSIADKYKLKLKQLEKEEKEEKRKNKRLIEEISNNDIDISEEEEEEEVQEEVEPEEEDEEEEVDQELIDNQDDEDIDQEEEEEEEEENSDEQDEQEEQDFNTDFRDVNDNDDIDEDDQEQQVRENITLDQLLKEKEFETTLNTGHYHIHFNRIVDSRNELDTLIEKSQSLETVSNEIEDIGIMTSIGCIDNQVSAPTKGTKKPQQPKEQTKSLLPVQKNTFHDYNIKKRLFKPWLKSKSKKENELYFTNLQKTLFPVFNEYRDCLYTEETMYNHKSIYKLYALHAVNHIFKSTDQLLEDNAAMNEAKTNGKPDPDLRHQGFTKPKVLIIVPYRNTALDVVKFILKLVPHEAKEHAELKTKFINEFTHRDVDQEINESKPDDYKYTFRDNIDDCFRLGLTFRKGGLKLYSSFYHSDIIIASPLGLRLAVGTEGDKQRDYDFLSSVEVVIMDQTDSILQQNWDHIQIIFDNLNKVPLQDHKTDFSRVRNTFLEGWGNYLRQTLIFSSILTPEINALFNRSCQNINGKIKIKSIKQGEISNIIPTLRQTFHRLPLDSSVTDTDLKFKFLIDTIIPRFNQTNETTGILLYIPNYYEYVKLRNYFRKEGKSYVLASEYTDPKAITRARAQFNEGTKTFMLYTERFHFYNRYRIRGIKHVIFFGLPQNTAFYSEILNNIADNEGSIISVYTNRDKLSLERIVGTSRSIKILESDKLTHLFC